MQQDAKAILQASKFGILAALAYSFNHPFSKAFLEQFPNTVHSISISIIITEFIGLLIGLILLTSLRYRREISNISKNSNFIVKMLFLSILSSLGFVSYYLSLTQYNSVYVAAILNLYPLYIYILNILINKDNSDLKFEPIVLLLLIIASLGMIVSTIIFNNAGLYISTIGFILISITPIFYCLSTIYQYRFFKSHDTFAYVSLSIFFDAPLFISLGIATLYLTDFSFNFGNIEFEFIAIFIIGGQLSGIVARFLTQSGQNIGLQYSKFMYVWLFLIPIFTGVIGTLLNLFKSVEGIGFNAANLYQIILLTLVLFVFFFYNGKKTEN